MKLIVLGTGVLDFILEPKRDIVLRDKHLPLGSKIDINDIFLSLGGGALNVSKTFQNLGIFYEAYFKLGDDLISHLLLSKIKKEKIKIKPFKVKGNSAFSIIVLTETGERTIFVYRGVSNSFTEKELGKIPLKDFYYLTTANTKALLFEKFLQRIRIKAKLIGINPSKIFLENKRALEVLKFTDIIFINNEEAETLIKRKDDPLNLGREIVKKINPKILVITSGENGSFTFFEDKIIKAGIFKPKKVVDFTGAGDAFASAFFGCLILNKKLDLETVKKAIIWGSANSSSNIEKMGAQIGLLKKNDYKRYENKSKELKIVTL